MSKHYREPVKHTCPDIDGLIEIINSMYKSIKGYEKLEDIEDLKSIISGIEWDFSDFTNILEKLRRSNDSLREWGIEESSKVDELESELEEARSLVS